jgi:hypothetical protein
VGSVPCTTANAEKKEPAGTFAYFKQQIRGTFHGGLVYKRQDFCRFVNVLGDIIHAIYSRDSDDQLRQLVEKRNSCAR